METGAAASGSRRYSCKLHFFAYFTLMTGLYLYTVQLPAGMRLRNREMLRAHWSSGSDDLSAGEFASDELVHMFLTILALCNTVVPEGVRRWRTAAEL